MKHEHQHRIGLGLLSRMAEAGFIKDDRPKQPAKKNHRVKRKPTKLRTDPLRRKTDKEWRKEHKQNRETPNMEDFEASLYNYDEENLNRIGRQIRKIRRAKNMSIKELAEKIGTSADMMQKYENGQKTPRDDRLKTIASCLDVTLFALTSPDLSTPIRTMYSLFELEERCGITISKTNGEYRIEFPQTHISYSLNECLELWRVKQQRVMDQMLSASKEERSNVIQEYNEWKWNFPKSAMKEASEEALKAEAEVLKKRLSEIDELIKNKKED